MDIKMLLSQLTLEEKVNLVAGTDFMYTKGIPRLGIPSLRMADGPHGLRVQTEKGDNGVTASLPATAFPTAATLASGWNIRNAYSVGRAIAAEAHRYGINLVLGPGVNIKRNPLAGRNFEYFSEDPLLAGKLGTAEVNGVQSGGVAVAVKHFALNNAENYRFMGNSVADMRAMREMYLKAFEIVVKESHPAAVMSSYNKINGEYCSQNKWLLTNVLRKQWGFDGVVMTDWGGIHDRVKSLDAGLDLEMPGDSAICRKWITEAIKDGQLDERSLDNAVLNILNMVWQYAKNQDDDSDFEDNDNLACRIAEDCAVLLKNDNVLPLDSSRPLFVCGELFERMRYQGAGSSMINAYKTTSPKQAFDDMNVQYTYAKGYRENAVNTDRKYIEEALEKSAEFTQIVVFAGLTDYVESEGCDRENFSLPQNQIDLIDALAESGKQITVVLFGGAPYSLPFADKVKGILNMYLPGQCGGKACANLLFGIANPSGRLAETWQKDYGDIPFGNTFSQSVNEIYRESIFVGYRYFLTANRQVRYPFGYGLSYTSFECSELKVSADNNRIKISCTVANTGTRYGAEVVQLYVSPPKNSVFRPLRELKAFAKVYLESGEKQQVNFTLDNADLGYFDTSVNDWVVCGGEYCFEICSDCTNVLLSEKLVVEGSLEYNCENDLLRQYFEAGFDKNNDSMFERLAGVSIPDLPSVKPITLESRFSTLAEVGLMGKILHKAVLNVADKQMRTAKKLPEGTQRENMIKGALFLRRILQSNSILSMSMCSAKSFPYNFAEGFVHLSNGKILKGIKSFCTPIKDKT